MSRVVELENEIKKLDNKRTELLKELEVETQKFDIEYPLLKMREMYWFINDEGLVFRTRWDEDRFDKRRCKIGNVFSTEEKAEKEVKKLSLLTRFRHFRDKCNGDWNPIFGKECKTSKFFIGYSWDSKDEQYKLKPLELGSSNLFNQFGYFKDKADCERAIDLFGDEIKELFMECE